MPGTVVSVKELARSYERELGQRPVAKRRWAVTLSDDTPTAGGPPGTTALATACGVQTWGTDHPDLAYLKLRKVSITERFEENPYLVEVTAEYGLISANETERPENRNAVWSFESQPGEVPALFYYHTGLPGTGNATTRPLTNSAYDFFPGLTTDESLVRIKIQKNFLTLSAGPLNWLSVQNFVNSEGWLGCDPHTIKVAAVEVQYTSEEWNGTEVFYWASTASLVYRQSSHNLLLPDVGFNYIDSGTGQKRRAMVFDFKNSEWVASANPVGLDGSGDQTLGVPAILNRRVYPEADLAGVFGSPPA